MRLINHLKNRLPRPLHPVAWWVWAIGIAVGASRTTNPLVLLMLIGVMCVVVIARAPGSMQLKLFRFYIFAGIFVILVRVFFAILLGVSTGGAVLFTLPSIQLPDWAVGISLGGPVAAETLVSAVIDGLRLATLLIAVGAANSLADPRRLLRVVPGALYEIGTAVVIAMTIAPQLVDSAIRVRRAQALRNMGRVNSRSIHLLRGLIIPILEDSLERSMSLAASMDSRGYGRRGQTNIRRQRVTSILIIIGLIGVCVGSYGVLDPSGPPLIGLPLLLCGACIAVLAVFISRSRTKPTQYRPDPWRLPEWIVAGSGIAVIAIMFFSSSIDPSLMFPSVNPLAWPEIPMFAIAAGLIALIPAIAAPPIVVHRIRALNLVVKEEVTVS